MYILIYQYPWDTEENHIFRLNINITEKKVVAIKTIILQSTQMIVTERYKVLSKGNVVKLREAK